MALIQQISKLIVFILICSFIESINAEVRVIKVGGGGQQNLKFDPQNTTAHNGDIIQWKFIGGNHNVVQMTAKATCEMLTTPDAFQSLYTNPPNKIFEININEQNNTYYYMCTVGNHCKAAGMWGVINIVPKPNEPYVPPSEDKKINPTNKPVGIVLCGVFGFLVVSVAGFLLFKRYKSKQSLTRTGPEVIKIIGKEGKIPAQDLKKPDRAKIDNVAKVV
ncbi:14752_t:CDS:2 [Funneliformis geosporum]|uniref:15918_t:CDS:1 n=1 Tax=Funneliformis geosporum TaxID=1117311 RepID=A0A9W4SCG0_9GLOM|nr:15918_t:CDS:2 [Funneliformis geosporum]CAI2166358.1 14752_t:CDS:2 [Funneliformis geosporum]